MIEEIWRDVIGFEGFYQVSSLGRVRSLDRNTGGKRPKNLKGKTLRARNCKGYNTYHLRKHGNQRYFRGCQLVAKHFLPNLEEKKQVNHINGDTRDDSLKNIEWVTHAENMAHASRERLCRFGESHQNTRYDDMRVLTIYTLPNSVTNQDASKTLVMPANTISKIRRGFARAHLYHCKPDK